MSYYVYILKSEKDNDFYVGQTRNLEERILRHQQGRVKSTRSRCPLKLLFQLEFATRAESMKMEKYLKQLKGGNEWKNLLKHWGVVQQDKASRPGGTFES